MTMPEMPSLEPLPELPEFQQGELLSFSVRPRRTGVIVGVSVAITVNDAVNIREQLEQRFPEVRFAVVPAAGSVAFEWDEPEGSPDTEVSETP
jgi:hypothetical protein